ncbi:hemolysin D [Mastigocoleus testarum BC008]|uniref:Hemolysin D n=1 Tax=Mastigocoleus testarum BC008 TaxID=371196 RepID=A0A0V7ZE49_9CYAN|nr:hemolysin D [Mastigocoleus testarum BC008]KST62763.1 hemolysin D [Mastigocoleus testarum BC008]
MTQQYISKSNNNKSPQSHDWSYATKELLDSLPQVWTRGLLYFVVVFIGIALPWAMFSQVDETGTAKGRLEPKGKTVRLDAPVEGTVAAIKVKEGESVKAGQKLLELKSELVSAELQQQRQKLEGQENRLHQQNLLKNQLILALRTQQQQSQAQQLEKQAQVEQAQQNLETLRSAYSLQKEELFAQIEQVRQAIESSKVAYDLEQIRLKTAQEKIPRYKKAYEEGALSQERFLETQQLAKEAQKNMMKAASETRKARSRLREKQSSYENKIHKASSDIKQAQLRWQEQKRSYKSLVHSGKLAVLKSEEQLKNLDGEITTLEAEVAQTKSQIQSLEFKLSQRVLKAPIDGIVFQLPIKGEGSVVQPGKMIMEIAPQGTSLVLRAQMATTESGYLEKGMPVKIKLDAYPFQDYGVLKGKLINISPTTSELDTPKGKVAVYNLEIFPNQNCIATTDKCIPLRPGDTVTAEVIVRQRRIIDYVIDPFKKLQQGG